jgi:putative two-component system response regulator
MVEAISLGSVIHDVGKIGIPDRILGKEGPLTAEEYEIIKQHAAIGRKILETVSLPEAARRSLANHHERMDGSGYPRGLRGEEIDIASRIIAAADVFDAIISDRPYSRPWSLDDACQHMNDGSGRQFDEDVIRVLLEIKAPPGWDPKK